MVSKEHKNMKCKSAKVRCVDISLIKNKQDHELNEERLGGYIKRLLNYLSFSSAKMM